MARCGWQTSRLPVSTRNALLRRCGYHGRRSVGHQMETVNKIALAWLLTLPATMLLAGIFLALGRMVLR